MLSKTAVNALRAFTVLADLPVGSHAGARAIAEKIDAGQNYLGKLLQSMVDEGLVVSQKGMGGGFRLNRKPEEITIFDVVEPIDHVSRWDGCFMGRDSCTETNPCAAHDRWKAIRTDYLTFLKETTLSDLNRKGESG
ncbi:MAG: Rrf2 family transcriptional regulator [Candidatus Omnitrophica bacterium]|nr:Rrf2 family transcriptional regulator [Candidatus Omnitrophota bacterium]